MKLNADKTSENKGQAIANSLPKQESGLKSAFQLVDNRAEAIAQRKLQETIDNSPKVRQLWAYQTMADGYAAQQYPIQKKENQTGLPDQLKSGIENLSGYSMDDVKVHYNSDKPAALNAHAYAQGTDIHLGSGQEKHLSHEAWHVVQQKQGRVKPTMQMKGRVNVNDDAGLEKEADVMGARALQMASKEGYTKSSNKIVVSEVFQMVWKEGAEGVLEWDTLIDGTQWFYNKETKMMHYVISAETSKDYTEFVGQPKFYLDWVALYGEFNAAPHQEMEKQDFKKESSGDEDNIRIIQELIPIAQSYGVYLKTLLGQGSIKGMATLLLNYADVLTDTARKKMEGTGTYVKDKVAPGIIEKLNLAINAMMAAQGEKERQEILCDFSGWMIANQVFVEGNNRANYFLLIMLGEITNTAIPSPALVLGREKIAFWPKKIAFQFKEMFSKMAEGDK